MSAKNIQKWLGKLSEIKSREIWESVQIWGEGRQKVTSFSWEKFKIREGGSSEIRKVPEGTKDHENNGSFSSYEDLKTQNIINCCTKHGQIYYYITHFD